MKARLACIASLMTFLALLCISIRYIKDFWLLAFVNSFQLHIAVLAGFAAVFCLAALRSRVFVFLLVWAMLLAGHAIYMQQEFKNDVVPSVSARPFRLLSFNVLMQNRANGESIADTIIASGADAVYVMEAAALTNVLPRLQQIYPYRLGCGVGTSSCDLLMLSKRPLENARIGSLSFVSRDRFGMASVNLDGIAVTLAAMHLTKPYFDEFHTQELWRAGTALSGVTGPLIVGGDFNAASLAPDVRAFLRDNDLQKVAFEPATWPVEAGPFGIAIDHIFARKPATLMHLQRLPDALGSNHYGLVADFMVASQ